MAYIRILGNLFNNTFGKDLINNRLIFYLGLFLLPSAFSLGSIFLLISIIINLRNGKFNYFKDRINIFFIFAGFFLFINSLIKFIYEISTNEFSQDSFNVLFDLLNWLPQILLFIGFQNFLINSLDRKKFIIALLSGSIPVIFSCFTQIFLNWYGPMEALFGLLIWYQRPIEGITGITGLFSNPNYLGAWLNIIWPFCLGLIYFDNKNIYKVIFKLILSISVCSLIILTASRAALLCLLIPIPFIYKSELRKWLIAIISLLSLATVNLSFPIFGIQFQSFLQSIIPRGIWENFTSLGFESLDISRQNIWRLTLNFIAEKPIFGHGSNAFPKLIYDETGFWKGHAHNLPLELMVNYGVPTTLILLIPIIYLIYKSFVKIFIKIRKINKETIIDRVWIISLSTLVLSQLVDIQYYDGRISIIGWLLLAGTRNILLEEQNLKGNT